VGSGIVEIVKRRHSECFDLQEDQPASQASELSSFGPFPRISSLDVSVWENELSQAWDDSDGEVPAKGIKPSPHLASAHLQKC